jgi:methenyltetrahydrofolate cyclohydrolase
MPYDQNTTIKDFLDAAGSKQPIPGGGSVAAMVGALAASMGEMVVNYSVGKKSLAAFEDQLKPAVAEYNKARQVLLQLMLEDQLAYEAFNTISKLKEDAPERIEKYDATLLACIRVPQAMGATAVAILELCDQMVEIVNPWLLSDLAVAADLAMATVRCAVYNVRVNTSSVKDAADRHQIEAEMNQILFHAGLLIQRVSPRIWQRVQGA